MLSNEEIIEKISKYIVFHYDDYKSALSCSELLDELLDRLDNSISKEILERKIRELYSSNDFWTGELSEPDSSFSVIDKNLKTIKIKIDTLEELMEEFSSYKSSDDCEF